MGLMSFFSTPKPNEADQAPTVAAPDSCKSGGEQLRSWLSIVNKLPADEAKELVVGTLTLNVVTFEEKYAASTGARNWGSDFREASLIHNLLSNLVGGNYLGFLAAHCLIYINRLRGMTWAPSTQEEFTHVGEMASLFFLHPHYQLNAEQDETEQAVLSRGTSGDSARAVAAIIKAARWDVARITLCAGMDMLSRNLMEVWATPEAHEQLVYRTLMLSLRVDNTIGALRLHQLAMAHHQRGWEWRPSPDEFHAVAESSARQLVDKRYNAAVSIPSRGV